MEAVTYSTELYHQIIQDYRERLSESIDLTLRSYCDERGLVYKKVVDWTTHHGISIRAMKADLLRRTDEGRHHLICLCKLFHEGIPPNMAL